MIARCARCLGRTTKIGRPHPHLNHRASRPPVPTKWNRFRHINIDANIFPHLLFWRSDAARIAAQTDAGCNKRHANHQPIQTPLLLLLAWNIEESASPAFGAIKWRRSVAFTRFWVLRRKISTAAINIFASWDLVSIFYQNPLDSVWLPKVTITSAVADKKLVLFIPHSAF